jgi:hypothetical protein
MINDDEFIALFNSPTRVLKAEKALRKAGLACRLIPAPRDVAEGCALALRFAAAERTSILFELGRQELLPRRMYQKHEGLFTSIPVSPEP